MAAIGSAPKGWISLQDAIEWFRIVDREEPCLSPKNVLSSIMVPDQSTVGNDAHRMIYGWISDGYPPVGIEVEILKKQVLERVSQEIEQNLQNSQLIYWTDP